MAVALDAWWAEAGEPASWTVIDAGAGPGTLLRAVLAAEPRCAAAMLPVAVDRAMAQRARHPEDIESRADLPEGPITGVVIANELLDNLPWRLVERTAEGWNEVWVDVDAAGGLIETLRPVQDGTSSHADSLAPEAALGARVPLQEAAAAWLTDALRRVVQGRIVVLDYGAPSVDLAARAVGEWMRTYRGHERGDDPLQDPGTQDITADVATDQLHTVALADEERSQAEFLQAHGLDDLVAEGRRIWTERAHLGDLEAIKGRSRVNEAAALTDPDGLGAFRVLEWAKVRSARRPGR